MPNSQPKSGPGNGVVDILRRIGTLLITAMGTRLKLASVELAEERSTWLALIFALFLSAIFITFALFTLLTLLLLIIPESHRVVAFVAIILIFFFSSILCLVWAIKKARRTPFLQETRKQLQLDIKALKKEDEK